MELWAIWVIIGLAAALIEIFTVGFAIGCFSFGAAGAAVAAWCGVGGIWQLLIFSVVTIAALIVVRPLMMRLFVRKGVATNIDALVGRRAVVTQKICGGEGRVSIDGDDWRAQIEDEDCELQVGDRVEVVRVESVILIIKQV